MDFEREIMRFCNILDKEINYLRQDESHYYLLTEGEFLKQENNSYIYIFNTEYEIRLTDSFPVTVIIKGVIYDAEIINIQKDKIILSFNTKINKVLDKIYLSCNPAFLLEGLKSRLKECYDKPCKMSREIIKQKTISERPLNIAKIEDMPSMIVNNDVTYIWGPPGTGKTTTLGKLVKKFILEQKRILILSHSNTAVDEAVLKIIDNFNESELLKCGKIIRYGYIQKDELKDLYSDYCDPSSYVLNHNGLINSRLSEINKSIKQFAEGNVDEEIIRLKQEKNQLYQKLSNERKDLIKQADVIATTISKATVDELVYQQSFDVVFLDEASMAYVPQVLFAASLATQKFICIGDMRQLAPISNCEELTQDIYTYLNMVDENNNVSHPNLVMLDKQYRFHPLISKFVSKEYYLKKMSNGISEDNEHIKEIVDSEPFIKKPIVLLDTSGFYASACITLEHSRINVVNACIAVIAATNAYKATKKSIGIVTPYAAQAKLIRKLLTDDLGKRKYDITCSTVHQFQGDEKDIIIFDTVESYPNERLGVLTRDNKNHMVDRLVNVAITRAKGKLIVIANYSYWKEYASQTNSFLRLMKYIERQDRDFVIGSNQLKKFIEKTRIGKIRFWDDDDNATYAFIEDLRAAKKDINIMFANGNDINDNCIDELKVLFKESNDKEIEIKTPIEHIQLKELSECTFITKRNYLPISIIDNEVVWYGIPDMNRYYDLKKDNHIYEFNKIMIRIDGKHISYVLNELLDFKNNLKILNAKSNGEKLKNYIEGLNCPICNSKIYLIHEKHFYTYCPHCMKKEYLKYYDVNKFLKEFDIKCPHDGGMLKASLGTYGLLLKCSEHHNIRFDEFFEI